MKFGILKYAFVFVMVCLSGAMLMDVSYRVQRMERQVARTDAAIDREEENIRVLKAEWAYLNDPARLERLSEAGLDTQNPNVEQIQSKIFETPEGGEGVQEVSIDTRYITPASYGAQGGAQ